MSRYRERLESMRMTPEELIAEDWEGKSLKALDIIEKADKVIIGAGAGLSASGGMDYFSEEIFQQICPQLYARGFPTLWEAMWYNGFTEEEKWALTATELLWACYDFPIIQAYEDLLFLVQNKDYFVMTSNGDRQFLRAGFDPKRFFAPQGNVHELQCSVPCCQETWDSEAFMRKIIANMNRRTFRCRPEDIPVCPYCGAPAIQNIRGKENFVCKSSMVHREEFEFFVAEARYCRTVFIELGVGFNSPGMIRHPFQRLTDQYPQATLLRFNLDYPKVPEKIADKSIYFGGDVGVCLSFISFMKKQEEDLFSSALDSIEIGSLDQIDQNDQNDFQHQSSEYI